jgi:hypothetical protein
MGALKRAWQWAQLPFYPFTWDGFQVLCIFWGTVGFVVAMVVYVLTQSAVVGFAVYLGPMLSAYLGIMAVGANRIIERGWLN